MTAASNDVQCTISHRYYPEYILCIYIYIYIEDVHRRNYTIVSLGV